MADIEINDLDDQSIGQPVTGPEDTEGTLDDQYLGQPVTGFSGGLNVYDSCTVAENCEVWLGATGTDIGVNVNDTVSVTENISEYIWEENLSLSVYDAVSCADYKEIYRIFFIDKSESVTVSESIKTGDLPISVVDNVRTLEYYAFRHTASLFKYTGAWAAYASGLRNIRNVIPTSKYNSIPFTVTSIRARISCDVSVGADIAGVSVGPRDSGDAYATGYIRLQRNNSDSFSATGPVWTDWEDYSVFDSGVDTLLHIRVSYYGVNGASTAASGYSNYWQLSGSDDTMTQDVSGYTEDTDDLLGCNEIEVGGDLVSYTSSTEPQLNVYDSVGVADAPTLTVSDPEASKFDTCSVSEQCTVSVAAVEDVLVNVLDSIACSDAYAVLTVSDPVIIIFDGVVVAEHTAAAVVGNLIGSVCWGHDTGVEESNIRDFSGNWTGTGDILSTDDDEVIVLTSGEYEESENAYPGVGYIMLGVNKYKTGTLRPTIKFKTAATEDGLAGEAWQEYLDQVYSLGWVKVRVEA